MNKECEDASKEINLRVFYEKRILYEVMILKRFGIQVVSLLPFYEKI